MRGIIMELVQQALNQLREEGILPQEAPPPFLVERPRDKSHGDYATNAAMVLAKAAGMKPRELAERLVAAFPVGSKVIQRCEVAGPGFINFQVAEDRLRTLVTEIRQAGERYGQSTIGAGRRVQVEFVSANPTGPMHVGHGRGAVFGDGIARLLTTTGFTVEREYYINDAGRQVYALGRSVLLRYRELHGMAVVLPEGCYPGEYVVDVARALLERDGSRWMMADEQEPPPAVLDFAVAHILNWIQNDLKQLEVIPFHRWFSERSLHEFGGIDHAISILAAKGLIYEGILDPPKGKLVDDWEPRPQLLFRSSLFGDEVDRPLRKSDGSYTYFAADIAYHLNKAERGYDALIDVWGADHGGYVKRVQSALEALTGRRGLLEVRLVQMVNLSRSGVPVRMSKRAGTFVTLGELLDEVGADAVRFWFLTRAETSPLEFDMDLAKSRSNDNPVFYVQYAHARICSVFRQLVEKGGQITPEELDHADLTTLTEEGEMDLIRLLGRYPEVVEGAALQREPHRIPYYLLDLAAAFHGYYNNHRILEAETDIRHARLALIAAVRQVIGNGLEVIGVSAPERL